MDRRGKTNPILWATFLDLAEVNPVILTKKFDSVNGRQKYDELWKEIAATLNSMGYIIQKSVEKWQKAVADWKSKVKGKAADINKGLNKTGGGGPLPPLNDNEKRLMAIIGWSVTGTNTAELGLDSETNSVMAGNVLEEIPEQNIIYEYNTSSPPPLHSLSENSDPVFCLNTASSASTSSRPLEERKVESFKRKRDTTSTGSTPKSFKENIATRNMQQMHSETLDVLKQINVNLGRMADTQENMCDILQVFVTRNNAEEV